MRVQFESWIDPAYISSCGPKCQPATKEQLTNKDTDRNSESLATLTLRFWRQWSSWSGEMQWSEIEEAARPRSQ